MVSEVLGLGGGPKLSGLGEPEEKAIFGSSRLPDMIHCEDVPCILHLKLSTCNQASTLGVTKCPPLQPSPIL